MDLAIQQSCEGKAGSTPASPRFVDLIVVHCSATPNGRTVTTQQIEQWHNARGFKGVGYHYVITLDGVIHATRPEDEIGAHALHYNAHSIGICMVGGTGGRDRRNPGSYTRDQWTSLAALVVSLRSRYPEADICGHRDLSPDLDGDGQVEPHEWIKICPAFDVTEWLSSGMVPRSIYVTE